MQDNQEKCKENAKENKFKSSIPICILHNPVLLSFSTYTIKHSCFFVKFNFGVQNHSILDFFYVIVCVKEHGKEIIYE